MQGFVPGFEPGSKEVKGRKLLSQPGAECQRPPYSEERGGAGVLSTCTQDDKLTFYVHNSTNIGVWVNNN